MRNIYDDDFASPADYEDGFEESDMARAERLGNGIPKFDYTKSVSQGELSAGYDKSNSAEKSETERETSGHAAELNGVIYNDPVPGMSEEQISDMMLAEQEECEDRAFEAQERRVSSSVREVMSKGEASIERGEAEKQSSRDAKDVP